MATHLVDTQEAESRLPELIRLVELGDDVIIARDGEPVAKIIPWPRPERRPGAWSGRVTYHGDIVGPDDDIASLFK